LYPVLSRSVHTIIKNSFQASKDSCICNLLLDCVFQSDDTKRIARPGAGKSGGFRSGVLYSQGDLGLY
jgi:hypothetical protein